MQPTVTTIVHSQQWFTHANINHYCPQSTLAHPCKHQLLLSTVNTGLPMQTSTTIVHSQHWFTHANINHCCPQSTLAHPCKNNSKHYLESEIQVSFHCFSKTVPTVWVSTWWNLMFLTWWNLMFLVGKESTVIHLELKSNHSWCLLSLSVSALLIQTWAFINRSGTE